MGYIAVDSLEQGMVLSEDVRDINTRLLLSKGQKIVPKHIRILKIWGVSEVSVVGVADDQTVVMPAVESENAEQIKSAVDLVFKHVNLENQTLNEIYRASLAYRLRGEFSSIPTPKFPALPNNATLNTPSLIYAWRLNPEIASSAPSSRSSD